MPAIYAFAGINRTYPSAMLTDAQIQELRESVKAAELKPKDGDWYWGYYVDGPLEGLKTKITPGMDGSAAISSWVQRDSDGQLVNVNYRRDGSVTGWKFLGFSRPEDSWKKM